MYDKVEGNFSVFGQADELERFKTMIDERQRSNSKDYLGHIVPNDISIYNARMLETDKGEPYCEVHYTINGENYGKDEIETILGYCGKSLTYVVLCRRWSDFRGLNTDMEGKVYKCRYAAMTELRYEEFEDLGEAVELLRYEDWGETIVKPIIEACWNHDYTDLHSMAEFDDEHNEEYILIVFEESW